MNSTSSSRFSGILLRRSILASAALGMIAPLSTSGVLAAVDVSKLPPASVQTVDYARDILPIFEAKCFRCHGPEKPKSRFRLDDREAALKGGSHGEAFTPGDSANSPLIHNVAGLDDDMLMPPEGKGERLKSEEIALLRAWIDQGAVYSVTNKPTFQFTLEPGVQWVHVDGNQAKFREHQWMEEGWDGGLQTLHFTDRFKNGARLELDAEARIGSPRYKLRFNLEKEDLGFVRGGFERFEFLSGLFRWVGILAVVGRRIDRQRDAWIAIGVYEIMYGAARNVHNIPRFQVDAVFV